MTDPVYFCIDGGGSKSRGRLVDSRGALLSEATAGPCNPGTHLDKAVQSVGDLWRQCCAGARRPPDRFDDVVFSVGAAGIYVDRGAKFLAACPPFARAHVLSDGYAALIGAGDGKPCSLIIIGTGVAGHRLFPNGVSIQRDAWGWIAGDRGSGSWIGQKALRHFFAALDGVVPQDELSRAISAEIGGIQGVRAGWMRDLAPFRLAALAPIVLRQADAGDVTSRRILDRAIEHLAALIGVITDRDTALYAAGGLVPALRERLAKKAGHLILEPKGDALKGCWLVASGQAPEERALLSGETMEEVG